jgi:hypothetical protein
MRHLATTRFKSKAQVAKMISISLQPMSFALKPIDLRHLKRKFLHHKVHLFEAMCLLQLLKGDTFSARQ